MGHVVPFIARVRDSGDWSTAERARLQELADRLAAGGIDVEVIFGATDEGDPWCVVTDGAGDVLIHVARIDGMFVVHSAIDDAVNENVDLHAALRDRLEDAEAMMAPQSATILPFNMSARQGQTFLALVVAAAFFYETAGVGDTAQAAELPHAPPAPEEPPPVVPDVDAPTQDRELAVQASVLTRAETAAGATAPLATAATTQTAPAAPADEPAAPPTAVETAPAQAPASAEVPAAASEDPPAVIRGGDSDDVIVGTAANEHILGGAGNDTLSGGGGQDTLDGGAGDDRIDLGAGVTAIGGEGADTFVIQAPTQLGHADTLLGVVLDFSFAERDRLIDNRGHEIKVPPKPGDDGKPTRPDVDGHGDGGVKTDPLAPTTGGGHDFSTSVTPLTRVEVDLDGDGVADGFVLVGYKPPFASAPDVVSGGSLNDGDPFGIG